MAAAFSKRHTREAFDWGDSMDELHSKKQTTPRMKTIPGIIILALTAFAIGGNPSGEPRPSAPSSRAESPQRLDFNARALWIKSRAYQSEDPFVYRLGAEQKLSEFRGEIASVKEDAGLESPAYFRTRVVALEQHHAYLAGQLARLTPNQIAERMTGARFAFDQCIEALEEAIDQARNEVRKLTMLAQR